MPARQNGAGASALRRRSRVAHRAMACQYLCAYATTFDTSQVVVAVAWHAYSIDPTPVDKDGHPTRPASPVPGSITLIDRQGHSIASLEVPDLVAALGALARAPRFRLLDVGATGEAIVWLLCVAPAASAALIEVEDWILATLYVPEEWSW